MRNSRLNGVFVAKQDAFCVSFSCCLQTTVWSCETIIPSKAPEDRSTDRPIISHFQDKQIGSSNQIAWTDSRPTIQIVQSDRSDGLKTNKSYWLIRVLLRTYFPYRPIRALLRTYFPYQLIRSFLRTYFPYRPIRALLRTYFLYRPIKSLGRSYFLYRSIRSSPIDLLSVSSNQVAQTDLLSVLSNQILPTDLPSVSANQIARTYLLSVSTNPPYNWRDLATSFLSAVFVSKIWTCAKLKAIFSILLMWYSVWELCICY